MMVQSIVIELDTGSDEERNAELIRRGIQSLEGIRGN